MPGKRTRKAASRRGRGGASARDRLLVWRGVMLVAVGGGGVAGLGVAHYSREGDAVTAGLFTFALLALLVLLVVALAKVRRALAETREA